MIISVSVDCFYFQSYLAAIFILEIQSHTDKTLFVRFFLFIYDQAIPVRHIYNIQKCRNNSIERRISIFGNCKQFKFFNLLQDFHFHLIYPIKKNEKKRLIAVISSMMSSVRRTGWAFAFQCPLSIIYVIEANIKMNFYKYWVILFERDQLAKMMLSIRRLFSYCGSFKISYR